MMKDIDRRLHRNKNGKGSPPKVPPEKYYTDNEATRVRESKNKYGDPERTSSPRF